MQVTPAAVRELEKFTEMHSLTGERVNPVYSLTGERLEYAGPEQFPRPLLQNHDQRRLGRPPLRRDQPICLQSAQGTAQVGPAQALQDGKLISWQDESLATMAKALPQQDREQGPARRTVEPA